MGEPEPLPISIRLAVPEDAQFIIQWLLEPHVLQWFPLTDLREIEDAVRIWMSYRKYDAVLTVLYDGVPCGGATLYVQSFQKLAHQCLFAIIISEPFRNKGIGKALMLELMRRAKEELKIELLHLEVYDTNPAIRLYQKLGFVQYGYQRKFIKNADGSYLGKIMMQRKL